MCCSFELECKNRLRLFVSFWVVWEFVSISSLKLTAENNSWQISFAVNILYTDVAVDNVRLRIPGVFHGRHTVSRTHLQLFAVSWIHAPISLATPINRALYFFPVFAKTRRCHVHRYHHFHLHILWRIRRASERAQFYGTVATVSSSLEGLAHRSIKLFCSTVSKWSL